MSNLSIVEEEFLGSFTLPDYIRTYTQSNSANPKYYEKGGKKLLIKFCNKELYKGQGILEPDGVHYVWQSFPASRNKVKRMVDFLVDTTTGQKVISNTNKVGKPVIELINGQDIYNGNCSRHSRNKLMSVIKEHIRGAIVTSEYGKTFEFINTLVEVKEKKLVTQVWHIKATKPLQRYPLIIKCELWDELFDPITKGQDWDAGNRILPYNKAFEDVLTQLNIIKDDCTKYVTGPPQTKFIPLLPGEKRKLVYKLYVDRSERVLNHPEYKKGLKGRLG